MQIIENSNVKEKVYIEKLENGMTIMFIPKKNIQKKYIIWATEFGSINNEFILPNEQSVTKIPDGVAHFLEHKMFEQSNGTNSLDTLTALGASANAYTTTDHTAFLFECTENFYEALDEYMDYIQHPYFTDKNVEKERGIIGQEIMMYQDYPDWIVYMNAIKCMYKNNPITVDIAGSIESISEINPEILYKCYNNFYNHSNMVMCVSGDFEPEELLKEIKKRLLAEKPVGEIKRIFPEEPEEIVSKQIVQKMDVSMPIFVIGIKDKINNKEAIVKKHIAIEILLNMLLGKSSRVYKELYAEGLIINEPYSEYEFTKNYAHIGITGQSNNPEKVLKKFQEEVENLKQKGLNIEHFKRIKKMIYGNYVREYGDVAEVSRMFISDYVKGINSLEYIEDFNEVTIEYAEQVLRDVFNENKTVISIVEGKK